MGIEAATAHFSLFQTPLQDLSCRLKLGGGGGGSSKLCGSESVIKAVSHTPYEITLVSQQSSVQVSQLPELSLPGIREVQ
jgi:hypothetical protein